MNGGKSPSQKGPGSDRARPRMSGPPPGLEALLEVEAGRPLGVVLERYAGIVAHIYRALGADALRPQIPRIKISNSVTSDGPDGRPWPPPEGTACWAIVRRRADGCTLWRSIELPKSDPLPADFCNPWRQQHRTQRGTHD